MKLNLLHSSLFLALHLLALAANASDDLQKCWKKQSFAGTKILKLDFEESLYEFQHNYYPWQQSNYKLKGRIWLKADTFCLDDSLYGSRKTYNSKLDFKPGVVLLQDYGETALAEIDSSMYFDYLLKSARYSPNLLVTYFLQKGVKADSRRGSSLIYNSTLNNNQVSLFLRKKDHLVEKIELRYYDQLLGDLLTVYTYSDYSPSLHYPATIEVSKANGKLRDSIRIFNASLTEEFPGLLQKPENYRIKGKDEIITDISTEKYNDHIYFIKVKQSASRSLLVEFNDFFLVEGAPLNSRNAELIIDAIRKINPVKPIRYFTFGHWHEHYLGGMRAFVHKGATVLTVKSDEAYVEYLATAPHTLKPDSLQLFPRSVKTMLIHDSLNISDGNYEMKIYFIGAKSEHTNDYLLYYFPAEKLLFEDDLVWISRSEPVKKAGKRQAGLYHALTELHLDVDTIIQSWPIDNPQIKDVIPFEDLKKSMLID